jgi:hypothetical protein
MALVTHPILEYLFKSLVGLDREIKPYTGSNALYIKFNKPNHFCVVWMYGLEVHFSMCVYNRSYTIPRHANSFHITFDDLLNSTYSEYDNILEYIYKYIDMVDKSVVGFDFYKFGDFSLYSESNVNMRVGEMFESIQKKTIELPVEIGILFRSESYTTFTISCLDMVYKIYLRQGKDDVHLKIFFGDIPLLARRSSELYNLSDILMESLFPQDLIRQAKLKQLTD